MQPSLSSAGRRNEMREFTSLKDLLAGIACITLVCATLPAFAQHSGGHGGGGHGGFHAGDGGGFHGGGGPHGAGPEAMHGGRPGMGSGPSSARSFEGARSPLSSRGVGNSAPVSRGSGGHSSTPHAIADG